MTHTDSPLDSPVEEGVFARLRTIAADEAAGTNPWPGLDRSIRRDRRNRLAGRGVTGVLVAALLGAAVVPSARHQVAEVASRLLGGDVAAQPVGGALGRDGSWTGPLTAALRDRLRAKGGFEPGTMRLLWTDELAGRRRAVVSVRAEGRQVGSLEPTVTALVDFQGVPGARPDQLAYNGGLPDAPDSNPDVWTWPQPGHRSTGDVAVLALCRGCRDAEWVGRSSFGADLSVRTVRGALDRSGADTWQGSVPEAQRPLTEVRATGPGGTAITSGPGPEVPGAYPDLARFGVPVERRDAVVSAGLQLQLSRGMTWRDVTGVRSARLTGPSFRGTLAAFRMPSGAWLVGSQTDPHPTDGWQAETALMRPADPSALLVPLLTQDLSTGTLRNTLAVLAPDGAVTVEANGVTVPVRDGGALLTFESGIRERVRITARDAAGGELASTAWPLTGGAGRAL